MISFSINLLVKCYCKLSKVFSDACIFKEHARYHEPLGNQEIVYSPPIMNYEWLESCFKWVGDELTANSSCIFRSDLSPYSVLRESKGEFCRMRRGVS
jgi:hypothetical protein